jgi:hypothetical protein
LFTDETHSWTVVLVGGIGTLKTFPIGTEAGIPLTYLPVDPPHKELPWAAAAGTTAPLWLSGLHPAQIHGLKGDRNTVTDPYTFQCMKFSMYCTLSCSTTDTLYREAGKGSTIVLCGDVRVMNDILMDLMRQFCSWNMAFNPVHAVPTWCKMPILLHC